MKSRNGITLIALVITIIVLLILAGVSISTIAGENGIIQKAKDASIKSKEMSYLEDVKMKIMNYNIEESVNSTGVLLEEAIDGFEYIDYGNDSKGYYEIFEYDERKIKVYFDENYNYLDVELIKENNISKNKSMITTWRVEAGDTIELPVIKEAELIIDEVIVCDYNFVVDWGDGTEPETYSSLTEENEISFIEPTFNFENEIMPVIWGPSCDAVTNHTYEEGGIYQITITGTFDLWCDLYRREPELISIDQWGETNTKQYIIDAVTGDIAAPGKNSFNNCKFELKNCELECLPNDLFDGVKELKIAGMYIPELTISSTVESLYIDTYNTYVNNINVDNNNLVYSSVDGVLYSKDKKELLKYPSARTGEFVVPDFVEVLGEECFIGSKVESVKLSTSVKRINENAFSDNENLTSIYIPNSVELIESCAFYISSVNIYCEAEEMPSGWNSDWIASSGNTEVIWNYKEN